MDTGLFVHRKDLNIYAEGERQILLKDSLFLATRTPFLLISLTLFVSAEQVVPLKSIHDCKR